MQSKCWGSERVLNLTNNYVVKRLDIKSGQNTSYHFHNKKEETFYIIDGAGDIILNGERYSLIPDSIYHIPPNNEHQIIADTNMIVIETSTPELNDVVRLTYDVYR